MNDDLGRDAGPDPGSHGGAQRDAFRGFTGRENWNAEAILDACARLRERRAAAGIEGPATLGVPADDVAPRRPVTLPGQRPPRSPRSPRRRPAPRLPARSRPARGRGARPVGETGRTGGSGRALYAAGICSAVAALASGALWLLVSSLSTPSVDPAALVDEFCNDLSGEDLQAAWNLGGENLGLTHDEFFDRYRSISCEGPATDAGTGAASVELEVPGDEDTQVEHVTYTVAGGVITAGNGPAGD
jgi:hypothetical protein